MHGRLKIKTTAEQAAEKQKERDEKKKLYLGGLGKAFLKRSSSTYDEEGLKITAQLLMANPDAATLWNFRREILLNLKGEDEEYTKLLTGELSMVEHCLMKNPKSYGAWHHRCWVMEKFPLPPWMEELALCNRYLKLDERNFHCWDYRRFITTRSNQQPEDELKISKELIERNLSNYSAWHYRSKLLPVVHPPSASTPHPIPVDVLIKELKTVVEAVFTDPSDQSPWFFLRWLINRQEKTPRLMQIGYDRDNEDSHLICVFSQPICLEEIPTVSVKNEEENRSLEWFSPSRDLFSNIWVTKLDLPISEEVCITLERAPSEKKTVTVPIGSTHFTEWVTEPHICGEELSDLTRSTLEEVKENCVTLDELDPDNKWVLLTLVDILWALDARNYQRKIEKYLSQLQALDPLRTNYYTDMKSKLVMETSLTQHRMKAEDEHVFCLSRSGLTRISFSHLLACVVTVDLSHNEIVSLSPLENLVTCRELILDNNKISDLNPLRRVVALRKLSLLGNVIDSVEQLRCLKGLDKLVTLDISSNPICDVPDLEAQVRDMLPSVQSLRIT